MTAKLTKSSFHFVVSVGCFLLGLLASSASQSSGGETFVRVAMSVCVAGALAFTFLALRLRRRARLGLDSSFTSQSFRVAYAVVALIITLVCLWLPEHEQSYQCSGANRCRWRGQR